MQPPQPSPTEPVVHRSLSLTMQEGSSMQRQVAREVAQGQAEGELPSSGEQPCQEAGGQVVAQELLTPDGLELINTEVESIHDRGLSVVITQVFDPDQTQPLYLAFETFARQRGEEEGEGRGAELLHNLELVANPLLIIFGDADDQEGDVDETGLVEDLHGAPVQGRCAPGLIEEKQVFAQDALRAHTDRAESRVP